MAMLGFTAGSWLGQFLEFIGPWYRMSRGGILTVIPACSAFFNWGIVFFLG